jgi:hypothetical protein
MGDTLVKKIEYENKEQFGHSQSAVKMLEDISQVYHGEIYRQLAEKRYAVGPVFTGHFLLRGSKICYSPLERK